MEVLFNLSGQVTGLRETWIFDPYYTAYAIEGLDRDGNGRSEPHELAELLAQTMKNLDEYDYYTRVDVGDARAVIERPSEMSSLVDEDRLHMTFLIPLAVPISAAESPLRYAIFDPTFYIEMLHAEGGDAVKLTGAPATCSYRMQAPDPDADAVALAYSLDQTQSAGDGLGVHFAEWVTIRCE